MRDAKPVLDLIVNANAVKCEQSKGGALMHAFQVKAASGDSRVLFCEEEVCRDHWVLQLYSYAPCVGRKIKGERVKARVDH
jgi:hypothetical protein